jgi:hypothetical protein
VTRSFKTNNKTIIQNIKYKIFMQVKVLACFFIEFWSRCFKKPNQLDELEGPLILPLQICDHCFVCGYIWIFFCILLTYAPKPHDELSEFLTHGVFHITMCRPTIGFSYAQVISYQISKMVQTSFHMSVHELLWVHVVELLRSPIKHN